MTHNQNKIGHNKDTGTMKLAGKKVKRAIIKILKILKDLKHEHNAERNRRYKQ